MQKAHQPKLMGFSRILVGSTGFELDELAMAGHVSVGLRGA
jgi:hypothetical protein